MAKSVAGAYYAMNDLTITLPGRALAGARMPRKGMEVALRRRLAMALYSDGILSGAAACTMAGVSKIEFQFLLGENGITQPLEESDLDTDAAGIAAWKRRK